MSERKISILHVILSLEIGGMERVVSELVASLDRSRFDVAVVCIDSIGPIGEELMGKGIKVLKLKPMWPIISLLFPSELIKVVRELRADIIHVHSGCWYKGAAAGFFTDVRAVIYTEHGRTFPEPKINLVLDRLYSWITSRVITVSHELASYMGDKVRISRKKIGVILNGIDNSRFGSDGSSSSEANTIGIIARLAPVKGIDILLRAVKIIVESGGPIRLLVVGDGPERLNLENLAEELGISSQVIFLGYRNDISRLLQQMEIMVLSSYSEGTSITLLEAMASGRPVVVTNVGGNPAIVAHGKNGFVVPAGEPEEMAAAIVRLLSDKALCKRIGAENRKKAREVFSLQAMTKAYEAVYAEAL